MNLKISSVPPVSPFTRFSLLVANFFKNKDTVAATRITVALRNHQLNISLCKELETVSGPVHVRYHHFIYFFVFFLIFNCGKIHNIAFAILAIVECTVWEY